MITKERDLTTILTSCVGATIPCPNSDMNFISTNKELQPQERCTGCNFEGRHYLLGDEVRLSCPCLNYPFADSRVCEVCLQTGGYGPHGTSCINCQGRTWMPNPDQDAWRQVVRALTIRVVVESEPGEGWGDKVLVDPWIFNCQSGHVDPEEGLRDFLAFATALKRTVEQMPDVEMGK